MMRIKDCKEWLNDANGKEMQCSTADGSKNKFEQRPAVNFVGFRKLLGYASRRLIIVTSIPALEQIKKF